MSQSRRKMSNQTEEKREENLCDLPLYLATIEDRVLLQVCSKSHRNLKEEE